MLPSISAPVSIAVLFVFCMLNSSVTCYLNFGENLFK
jgi:hypothetical protein